MASYTKVNLCLDYVVSSTESCLDCYYLDEKNDNVLSAARVRIQGSSFKDIALPEIQRIAEEITHFGYEKNYKLSGKVNYIISSNQVFTHTDVFPSINKSKFRRLHQQDIAESFTDYDKNNAYIEVTHEDGNIGICVLTTLCPLVLVERFELLAKELKMQMGHITSANYSLTNRYEKYYSSDLPSGVLIDLERDYTLINLFIDKTIIEDVFIPVGYSSFDEGTKENEAKALIKSRLLSLIAKHSFGLEHYDVDIIKICASDALKAQRLHDYLSENTEFEIGFTVAKPLATSKFPTKYTFKRYQKRSKLFSRGFTLVECVTSLAIFALISGVAIGCLVPMSNVVNKNSLNSAITRIVTDISETYKADSVNFVSLYYTSNGVSDNSITETKFYYNEEFNLLGTTDSSKYVLEYQVSSNVLTVTSFSEVANSENLINSPVLIKGITE